MQPFSGAGWREDAETLTPPAGQGYNATYQQNPVRERVNYSIAILQGSPDHGI
jgi:hypothetical protein